VIAAGVPVLVGVGLVAGVVSTVASVASIVSYPALLALGLPPLSANVTNTVALVFTAFGAAAGSRPELAGQARLVWRLGMLTAAGGAAGATLLLLTPARMFEMVAPWLIAMASLVLLFQPRLRRPRAGVRPRSADGPGQPADAGPPAESGPRPAGAISGPCDARPPRARLALSSALFATAAYVGYFGAAGGILVLAVLTPLLRQPLVRVNAIKNVVSGFANGVAATAFAIFGPVDWTAAVPLAAGFLAGGWLGPLLARRLPAAALRVLVGVTGLAVAGKLALGSYR
jgi:uncharacterized protein